MSDRSDELREQILSLVSQYHSEAFPSKHFQAGQSTVPVAGRVFDDHELRLLIDSALEFWLTTGRYAAEFERRFAQFFGMRRAILTNSGSSANLLAVSALTSPLLKERQLLPGDEVITVAAGFPTTVNPIVQNNLVPVFVDVDLPTYNVSIPKLEAAIGERTRAIVLAHTLGNPFDLGAVTSLAKKHNLWLVEDCCDAVGSMYDGKSVGSFGSLATTSFYPAHHLTMGEGGCVLTDRPLLMKIVESIRDWGRDCWCEPGRDNTCGKRFDWQLGTLPHGYDHKYIYSHIGYNLKLTDMQAAVGVAQLDKLPSFIEARRKNFRILYAGLQDLQDVLILPEATENSTPSWFGFPIAVKPSSPKTCRQIVELLNERQIGTRMLFAGNLTRQPAYQGVNYRVCGSLETSDFVANHVFWIGLYPGLTENMLQYVIEVLHELCRREGHA